MDIAGSTGRWLTLIPRGFLRLSSGLAFSLSILFGVAAVAAGESEFEIVVSINTVVRAPNNSETVLAEQPVPHELVGETCSVIARSMNQSSVHPGNDLIVESQTRVVLVDVEAEPGGTVTATDTMELGDRVLVTLVMGPDEVFSAGVEVLFDCPPEPTTTTVDHSTTTVDSSTTTVDHSTTTVDHSTTTVDSSTTTVDHSTTTTDDDSSTSTTINNTTTTTDDDKSTSTTINNTTTTTDDDDKSTSTTINNTTTTTGPTTTTTPVEDEELVHTGPPDGRLALLAIAMTVTGVLLLAGERSAVVAGDGSVALFRRRCSRCRREAEFKTPHGRLCKMHTRVALHEDTVLWMPIWLKRGRQG